MSNPNTVRKSISFDALDDHDVLLYLSKQDNSSEAIRAALRQYIGQPSQRDVMDTLEALTDRIEEVLHVLRSKEFVAEVKQSVSTSLNKSADNLSKMVNRWSEE